MKEMTITVQAGKDRPKYNRTAAELLKRCREFYQDPENERAFQEWMARKDGRHEKAAV